MSDPLSDPRAIALQNATVAEVDSIAGVFHTTASTAAHAAGGLRSAKDAHWEGKAADAFRTQLGKLPKDLDNVNTSYGQVATALDNYATDLEPIQTKWTTLSNELIGARTSLATANTSLQTAQTHLQTFPQAHQFGLPLTAGFASGIHSPAKDRAYSNAQADVNDASTAVGNAQDNVSGLEKQCFALLDHFDSVRSTCIGKISSASHVAPEHHWWQSVGHFFVTTIKSIGTSAWNVISGKDFIEFAEHPSWKTFGQMVKDVAVTASLVAMVVAPFAAPELAGADLLADGGIEVATDATADVVTDAATDGVTDAVTDGTTDAVGDGATDTTAEGAGDGAGEPAGADDPAAGQGGGDGEGEGEGGGNGDGEGEGSGEGEGEGGGESDPSSFAKAARGFKNVNDGIQNFSSGYNVTNDIAHHQYGAAAFDGFVAVAPAPGDLVTNKVLNIGDDAVKDAKTNATKVDAYRNLRASGVDDDTAKTTAFGSGKTPSLNVDWNAKAERSETIAKFVGEPSAEVFDKLVSDPLEDKFKTAVGLSSDGG